MTAAYQQYVHSLNRLKMIELEAAMRSVIKSEQPGEDWPIHSATDAQLQLMIYAARDLIQEAETILGSRRSEQHRSHSSANPE